MLAFSSLFLFIIKDEEAGRGAGEAGVRAPCSLDCLLLSGGNDVIFGDPRKLECWLSPGRAGCFTGCPGSVGPGGARKVLQAVYEAGPSRTRHFETVQDI